MIIALLILHALITIMMIGLILLQKSDGSGPLGIGGGNNSLFTARGVANILTRTTAVLAALFIGNCLLIGILTSKQIKQNSQIFATTTHKPAKAAGASKNKAVTDKKEESKEAAQPAAASTPKEASKDQKAPEAKPAPASQKAENKPAPKPAAQEKVAPKAAPQPNKK